MSSNPTRFRSWQEPPPDIMEKIIQRLDITDRIRLKFVCESWRSVARRRDIRGAPQLPWLVHPHNPRSKYLIFSSLTNGQVHKLRLPPGGWWFYGSSKGWLIMVKGKGLNAEILVLNPISGAQHKVPSFHDESVVIDHEADSFLENIELSSANESECMVAAVFECVLGLCKLGDKSWTFFLASGYIINILFSCGKLYAVLHGDDGNMEDESLNFGDNVVEVKFVFDSFENLLNNPEFIVPEIYPDSTIMRNSEVNSYLLESANNEVLLIHQIYDRKTMYVGEEDDLIHICIIIHIISILLGQIGLMIELNSFTVADALVCLFIFVGAFLVSFFLGGVFVAVNKDDEGGDEGNNNNEHLKGDDDDEADGAPVGDDDNEDGESDEEVDDSDEEDEGGVEGDRDLGYEGQNVYFRTSGFRVYKIGSGNNFDRVQSLGDQILLLADQGSSLCLSASDFEGLNGNCIYFASNGMRRLHPLETLKPNMNYDLSVFCLDDEKIEPFFSGFDMQMRFFIPCL